MEPLKGTIWEWLRSISNPKSYHPKAYTQTELSLYDAEKALKGTALYANVKS